MDKPTDIINLDPVPKDTWTAAKIKITFTNGDTVDNQTHTVDKEETEHDMKQEMQQHGVSQEEVDAFQMDTREFQGRVFVAARKLAVSPLMVPVEDTECVRIIPPWYIKEVEVIPSQQSRILTPTTVVQAPIYVSEQRTN